MEREGHTQPSQPVHTVPKTPLYGLMVRVSLPHFQRGRMQMYKLGLKIRSLYNGFLDELYYGEDFVAKSTAFERTIQSAQLFLAGLFPPRDFQVWNKTLLWQPIPVFHSSVDYQEMANVSQTKWCPKFRVAKEKAIAEFQQEYRSDIIEFFKLVNPYTRMDQLETLDTTVSISLAIFVMWESFYTMVEEGLSLPSWAEKFYPQPLTFLAEKLLRVAAIGSDTQIRYLEGLFFKELVDLMRSKVEGTLIPDRKMFYYCGHDFTLLGFQGILGLADGQSGLLSTRTGSALIFELHKDLQTDLFYVQVLHIDGTSSDMEPSHVEIPGCNSPCDLRRLLNLTEKYYNITDWKKECQIIED
ncbi:testicular acid phosphatase homolog isoform X2 [Homalodisca vitripennis]|uniref:testicular acid phosphatase homolog isoform X2 n=1 Tax=Homalodisca vitripennis TaxID=197043 RepID=UPI001EEA67E2|nr:testicular acid phosphatase homolog isoform X2 [Homalodisca vitripennis]